MVHGSISNDLTMGYAKQLLITGGAGFIGSHVVRLFVNRYPNYLIVNADALTYAGNLENLTDIDQKTNYRFKKIDIRNRKRIFELFEEFRFNGVIHLAAESHVDRSIHDPGKFLATNILGTSNLMDAYRKFDNINDEDDRFYHISTDEVYGSLGESGYFTETTPYDPQSPYSASKAASDHLVRAYGNTYGMPYVVSNCSNNYGPNQFPEKLIPLVIHNIIQRKPLPIYGDGLYTRDWLFVSDHASVIDQVYHKGKNGEMYNIGGFNEWKNIDLVKVICKEMDIVLDRPPRESETLICFVKDRPGHDRRYAIDASKIKNELGWKPSVTFEEGIKKTIDWYLNNGKWLKRVTSGEYQKYHANHYD